MDVDLAARLAEHAVDRADTIEGVLLGDACQVLDRVPRHLPEPARSGTQDAGGLADVEDVRHALGPEANAPGLAGERPLGDAGRDPGELGPDLIPGCFL